MLELGRTSRVMIADHDPRARHWPSGSCLVRTPLEFITTLEYTESIARVVLVGEFARDRAFAAYVEARYPAVALFVARSAPASVVDALLPLG